MKREKQVGKIREFNRFYTNVISILDRSVLHSNFSLAEARVLYEIRRIGPCSARKILEEINIDEGYLSRILNRFVSSELVIRMQSDNDKRRYVLRLSRKGIQSMDHLDSLMNTTTTNLIDTLTDEQLSQLLESMEIITQLLTPSSK